MMTPDPPLLHCSRGDRCAHPDGPLLPATPDYFPRRTESRDGLYHLCKACRAEDARRSYAKRAAEREQRRARSAADKQAREDRLRALIESTPKKANGLYRHYWEYESDC